MEPAASPVAARRFLEGHRGAALPERGELELAAVVAREHRRLPGAHGVTDAGTATPVDLGACVAALAAAAAGRGGAAHLEPQPVDERWRPAGGATAAFMLGHAPSIAGMVFTGLAGGGTVAVVLVPLTVHPTAPMYAAVGVYADGADQPTPFAIVEPLLPMFVRSEQPRAWLEPGQNAALVLAPEVGLEPILERACMYRVAQRVSDPRVGSANEGYDPRRLGAIARRCAARMAVAAAGPAPHRLAPPPVHSPLRRRGRRRGAALPLPRLPAANLGQGTELPPLPTPVRAPSPGRRCHRQFAEAFYSLMAQCAALSPTRYIESYQ